MNAMGNLMPIVIPLLIICIILYGGILLWELFGKIKKKWSGVKD